MKSCLDNERWGRRKEGVEIEVRRRGMGRERQVFQPWEVGG